MSGPSEDPIKLEGEGELAEKEALAKFREMVEKEQKESGLQCPTDDKYLLRFLRGKKGDPDAAFRVLQAYFNMRHTHPKMVPRLNPADPVVRSLFDSGIMTVLKHRDSEGRHIMLFKTRFWTTKFNVEDIMAGCYLIAEEMTSYEETQRNGIVMICDHGGLSYMQMTKIASQISIGVMKSVIAFYQGAYPARFAAFHVVHHPLVFDLLLKLGFPFMSDKFKRRLMTHGKNVQNLQRHFDSDIIPESYGGTLPDEESSDEVFFQRFYAKEDHYKKMSAYGYKEKSKST